MPRLCGQLDLLIGPNGLWALEMIQRHYGNGYVRHVFLSGDFSQHQFDLDRLNECRRDLSEHRRDLPFYLSAPRSSFDVLPHAQLALSVHYPIILGARTLAEYDCALNLHPGFLPFGRGMYPVAWAILDGTPAGATLHVMAERVDTGRIVAQREVEKQAGDTAASLCNRVYAVEKGLLADFIRGRLRECAGQATAGTYHSKADFEAKRRELASMGAHDAIARMSALELLDRARAFTHPPYPGLEVKLGDVVYRVSLEAFDHSMSVNKERG